MVISPLGEAEDHDIGVVVVVDALHGLDEVVSCVEAHVEGLLIELIEEDPGFTM